MTLTNDCVDCLNAFEDLVVVNGRAQKVMKCEYMHATFPHAMNCSTCQPEVCHGWALGIGGAYAQTDE